MPQAQFTLPGDSAVITAGGAGIGKEIARSLVDTGVNVVINDIDEDALDNVRTLFQDLEGSVVTVQGNACDPAVASELVDTAVNQFGALDIIVNNVGIAGPTKPCEKITKEEFIKTLEVNLGAMFALTKESIPYLRKGADGRIVNISSMSGKRPLRDRTPYTTSKMGVIGFTRTLAVELATDDITVNAICPGSVNGERLQEVIAGQANSQDREFEEVKEEFLSVSPMKRFVEPEDIASTVLYLCSEQTCRMTGQDLNVTAGITMH